MSRWLLAAFHLLAFGIGLGAIWSRADAFRAPNDPTAVRRALTADAWWGVAAALWLATGLPRLLLGTEKATAYYLADHIFWLKMLLFGLIILLELGPIVTLPRWRKAIGRGEIPDTRLAGRFRATSQMQIVLLLLMLFAATAMARGY